jgi:tRNA-intron endonuclease
MVRKTKKKVKHPEGEPHEEPESPEGENGVSKTKLKEPVRGYLSKDKVIVTKDYEKALELYDKGSFGEIHGVKRKRLEFSLIEALYLLERDKVLIFNAPASKKALTFEQFVNKASKVEPRFWIRYQVYRDIRTRGYIVKTALKFGADFRVYRRGIKPGEDHAKWVLFCVSENEAETWSSFSAKNRVAHSTRKKLLVGCVDAEGDVTYWEIRWKKP